MNRHFNQWIVFIVLGALSFESNATNLMSSPRAIDHFDFNVGEKKKDVSDRQLEEKIIAVGIPTLVRRIDINDSLYRVLGDGQLTGLRKSNFDRSNIYEQLEQELTSQDIQNWIGRLNDAGINPLSLLNKEEQDDLQDPTPSEPLLNPITFAGIGAKTLFGGLSLGGGDEQRTIKLTALQYDVLIGRDMTIPFAILSADVSSVGDSSMANAQKLLDPDQGVLNLQFTKAYKFKLGRFCDLDGATGCTIGAQGGFRFTELEETKMIPAIGTTAATTETDKQTVWGGYARVGVNSVFDVIKRVTGEEQADYGKLSLGVNYNWYRQNLSDSTILFPNATDSLGNPVMFDKSYESLGVHAELALPGQFSLKAQYFDPMGNGMEDTFSIELTFTPKREEE